jgi:hypothetical protein
MELDYPNKREREILLKNERKKNKIIYLGRKIGYLHPKIYEITYETYKNFRMLKNFGIKDYFFGSTKGVVDFLLIGFPKCGTTSLHNYLNQHPKIFSSWIKEPHFFSYGYEKGVDYYEKNFRFHKDSIHFEGSTEYIFYPEIFRKIKKYNPKMKFIVCLRNPVEQVFSTFNHLKQTGIELNSFEDTLDEENLRKELHLKRIENKIYTNHKVPILIPYLYVAEYYTHIKNALEIFDYENFFFVDDRELKRDSKNIINKIFDFLDLDKIEINSKKLNVREYEQEMDPETRAKLVKHFKPINSKLENLLDQKFDWN